MYKKVMGAVVAAAVFAAPAMAQDDMDLTGSTEVQAEPEADVEIQTEGDVNVQGSVEADDGSVQTDAYGGSADEGTTDIATTQVTIEEEDRNDMRGLVVTLGGGVEGYTGDLRSRLDVGPAWGVTAAIKPTKVLGLELGYTGAANEIGNDELFEDSVENGSGADIVRNGGHALATVGLPTPIQPYLLAGVGVSRYSVRADTAAGFQDDWAGAVPVGAGVRTHLGNFTADLRGTYSMLFSQDLIPAADDDLADGRWGGTLQIGTTF